MQGKGQARALMNVLENMTLMWCQGHYLQPMNLSFRKIRLRPWFEYCWSRVEPIMTEPFVTSKIGQKLFFWIAWLSWILYKDSQRHARTLLNCLYSVNLKMPSYDEIGLIFDPYITGSLKYKTRQRRAKNIHSTRYCIADNTFIKDVTSEEH